MAWTTGRPAKTIRAYRRLLSDDDPDPMASVANLFDAAMGFAAALLVALAVRGTVDDAATASSSASAPTAEQARRDAVSESREKLARFRESEGIVEGEGLRLGVAYRLNTGEVVYVPEGDAGGR